MEVTGIGAPTSWNDVPPGALCVADENGTPRLCVKAFYVDDFQDSNVICARLFTGEEGSASFRCLDFDAWFRGRSVMLLADAVLAIDPLSAVWANDGKSAVGDVLVNRSDEGNPVHHLVVSGDKGPAFLDLGTGQLYGRAPIRGPTMRCGRWRIERPGQDRQPEVLVTWPCTSA